MFVHQAKINPKTLPPSDNLLQKVRHNLQELSKCDITSAITQDNLKLRSDNPTNIMTIPARNKSEFPRIFSVNLLFRPKIYIQKIQTPPVFQPRQQANKVDLSRDRHHPHHPHHSSLGGCRPTSTHRRRAATIAPSKSPHPPPIHHCLNSRSLVYPADRNREPLE
jgi:hypothetical protein